MIYLLTLWKINKLRSRQSLELSYEATEKHWQRARRKVEIECLLHDGEVFEWKLGVAHEGPFPGRRRVVLRPRYLHVDANKQKAYSKSGSGRLAAGKSGGGVEEGEADAKDLSVSTTTAPTTLEGSKSMTPRTLEQLGKALAHAAVKDLPSEATESVLLSTPVSSASASDGGEVGSGWGIVDVDGSEEGVGVIGLAQGQTPSSSTHGSSDGDGSLVSGGGKSGVGVGGGGDCLVDVHEIDDAFNHGRCVETGPAFSGTR